MTCTTSVERVCVMVAVAVVVVVVYVVEEGGNTRFHNAWDEIASYGTVKVG